MPDDLGQTLETGSFAANPGSFTDNGRRVNRALILSSLLHAGAIATVAWLTLSPGATFVKTQAISVEVIPSNVTEAVDTPDQNATSAATPSAEQSAQAAERQPEPAPATDQTPTQAENLKAEPAQQSLSQPERTPPNPEPQQTAEAEPAPAQEASQADAPPEPALTAPQPDTATPDSAPSPAVRGSRQAAIEPSEPKPNSSPPKRTQSNPARPRPAKPVAQTGPGAAPSKSNRVSAQTGSSSSYRNLVLSRVLANKPRPSGVTRSYVMTVDFSVAASGGLASARISRSSGAAALDQSALDAVRNASPFPPPPPGAARRFSYTFTFTAPR
jgi:protein TonB